MGERVVVSVVILIIAMFLVVYMIEIFIPLSVNLDFRDMCRNYLMKMEFDSELSNMDISDFKEQLQEKGFTDILIEAPNTSKFGESMELKVSASYRIKTIVNIFIREQKEYIMRYKRFTIARKAIN